MAKRLDLSYIAANMKSILLSVWIPQLHQGHLVLFHLLKWGHDIICIC